MDVPSVATTSTKSPSAIKADIKRVLDRMQVQYRPTKSGFECIHLPSIDLSSLSEAQQERYKHTRGSTINGRRSVGSKGSKLTVKGKDREPSMEEKESDHQPGRPMVSASSGSSSFFNTHMGTSEKPTAVQVEGSELHPQESDPSLLLQDDQHGQQQRPAQQRRSQSPSKQRYLPPIPRDFVAAGTDTTAGGHQHHKEGTGNSAMSQTLQPGEASFNEAYNASMHNGLAVRFEVNIVKVRAFFLIAKTSSNFDITFVFV